MKVIIILRHHVRYLNKDLMIFLLLYILSYMLCHGVTISCYFIFYLMCTGTTVGYCEHLDCILLMQHFTRNNTKKL